MIQRKLVSSFPASTCSTYVSRWSFFRTQSLRHSLPNSHKSSVRFSWLSNFHSSRNPHLQNTQDRSWVSRALASHPLWNKGRNHLVFSLIPPATPPPTGEAILASAALSQVGFPDSATSLSTFIQYPLICALSSKRNCQISFFKYKCCNVPRNVWQNMIWTLTE